MENYNVSHSVWYKLGNIWHKVFDLVISQGALKRNSQLSSSISGEFLYKSVNIWVITANNLTKRQTKEFMWLLWFKLINVTVNVRIWGHMKNKQAAALNLLSLGGEKPCIFWFSFLLLVHVALKLLSPDCRCYQKMNTQNMLGRETKYKNRCLPLRSADRL